MQALEIVVYSAVLWLGLFVLSRDFGDELQRSAGLGIVSYAAALALQAGAALPDAPPQLNRLFWAALVVPPAFWTAAIVHLAGPTFPPGRFILYIMRRALSPLITALFFFLAFGQVLWEGGGATPGPIGIGAVLVVSLLPLLVFLAATPALFKSKRGRSRNVAVATATIFFTLGAGLLVFPLEWLDPAWVLLAIAFDFEILGLAILRYDAFETGEVLLPEFLRSFVLGLILALLFGGQVLFGITLATGYTAGMALLLHFTIAVSFFVALFLDPLQTAIDRFVFRRQPILRTARAEQRLESRARARLNPDLDPIHQDEETFARLTRKALSNFGDLPKLAASPLTNLEIIDRRLGPLGRGDNTLERARELKRILAESIQRLKPGSQAGFGESDEWRFYNALYFPYVVGLRPYSRRALHENLDAEQRLALEWFRGQVPERTLYNWQSTAAGLVAQDIRERSRQS